MQKIYLSLALLMSSLSHAIIINVQNNSPVAIVAGLYEAVEDQSSLGEPELEQQTKKIAPGQLGIIDTGVDVGMYELDAHDAGKDIFKTTRGRKLDIQVSDDSQVFNVTVNKDSIAWTPKEACETQEPAVRERRSTSSRHPHHRPTGCSSCRANR